MTLQSGPRPPSGTQWTIAADGHEAVVVEVGGGLRAYRSGGFDDLDGYGEDEMCLGGTGQVLAPWPNRIRDGRYLFAGEALQLSLTEATRHNAIHGLVNWLPWRLAERDDASVTVECEMPAQPGYPWPLTLRTRWSVGAAGLTATHSATNAGVQPCPYGMGTHPYFRLPAPVDEVSLTVPARSRLLVDGRMLPIGAAKVAGGEFDFTEPRPIGSAVLDVAFGDLDRHPDGHSAVVLAGGGREITVWADGAFRWWQVFTGDTLPGERHRRSVAVEPLTCPPDAFRSGRDVVVLEPGETWTASWGVRS
jgi:aldose 1-epimerase